MTNTLKLLNISKSFLGVKAVDCISLELERGKIYGFIGPNGSGKTTLINLLSGVFRWEQGIVMVGGKELSKVDMNKILSLGITRTFQEVSLFEQMTVLDNLLVVLTEKNVFRALFSRHKKAHVQQARELLEQFNLWDKRSELVVGLSYGQRKLLEVARAVAVDASIYLFDEPFAGLFHEMRNKVVEVLERLRSEGKCVMLIEHNMEIIRQLSDCVVVLDGGRVLAKGRPEIILTRSDVIEAYLGS